MKPAAPLIFAVSVLTCLTAMILGLAHGSTDIELADILSSLTPHLSQGPPPPLTQEIVWNLRLPRVCVAALVGASLGVSGAALQGLFRNPLADPYVLGIASGGAFGASIILWLSAAAGIAVGLTPLGALIGAVVAAAVVFGASQKARGLSLNTVLLAGVAVGLVFSALLSLVLVMAGRQAGDILGWLLGSLSGQSWSQAGWISMTTLIGLSLILTQSNALDAFLMGEEAAAGVGVDLKKVKVTVLGASVILVAGAVAFCGLIGFVGLIVPHMVRRWTGPGHKWCLLTSTFGGAALLVAADLISRLLVPERELPVGVITGCLGGPFFLFLLIRGERHA